MKPVFAKKAARPDPELLTLKAELLEAQGDLAQAYRRSTKPWTRSWWSPASTRSAP